MRTDEHQEDVGGDEPPTRARLFIVGPNMISGPPGTGGSDELDAALDRTLVADVFAQLAAEHRAVVRRAFYYGWSTAQIGADLGIDDAAVKSRLHDALLALRQTLQERGSEQ